MLVVFGIDIKEASFADAVAARVFGDRANVEDGETDAVVGLVAVAIDDVLVVVDGAAFAFVVTGVKGVLEVADVEDVCGWEALGHGTDFCVALVELVVEEDIFLPCFVVDDTLVDVLGAGVAGDGDDVGCVSDFVGNIVCYMSVFVPSTVI